MVQIKPVYTLQKDASPAGNADVSEATISNEIKRYHLAQEVGQAISHELTRRRIQVVDNHPDVVVEVAVEQWGIDSLHGASPIVGKVTLTGKMESEAVFHLAFEQKPSFWRNLKEPAEIGMVLARQLTKKLSKLDLRKS